MSYNAAVKLDADERAEPDSVRPVASFEFRIQKVGSEPAAAPAIDAPISTNITEPADAPVPAIATEQAEMPTPETSSPAASTEPIPTIPMETLFLQPYPIGKRIKDVVGAGVAIILLSPLMLAVAIGIRLTSKGPIIFKQVRGGHGGRPFTVYKFRSMVVDAEEQKKLLLAFNERNGPAFKMKHDPRVTPFGRFIRKTSLDELPQLFNVLKGDMALVGPRPLPYDEGQGCETWHRKRHDVKPGVTCIWQITSRDEADFDHWVRLDLKYIKEHSPWYDLKLLIKTIPAVIFRRGAH